MGKVTLIGKAKNEGPYILEWICHHYRFGFDNIVLVTNDLTDGSDELLSKLSRKGYVNWVDVSDKPLVRGSIGARAYKYAFEQDIVKFSDWVIDLDVDEFFYSRKFSNVKEFISRYNEYDAVVVNWKLFGSSGLVERHYENLVMESFVHSVPINRTKKKEIKTFCRPARLKALAAHFPIFKDDELIKVSHSNHQSMNFLTQAEAKSKVYSNNGFDVDYTDAEIRHYVVKSLADYVFRQHRGDALRAGDSDKYNYGYFLKRNRALIEDAGVVDEYLDLLRSDIDNIIERFDLFSDVEAIKNYYMNILRRATDTDPGFLEISGIISKGA